MINQFDGRGWMIDSKKKKKKFGYTAWSGIEHVEPVHQQGPVVGGQSQEGFCFKLPGFLQDLKDEEKALKSWKFSTFIP